MSEPRAYIRVYVWELPVRLFHWANALCITVLCTTGFLIAHPPALLGPAEASDSYWFGTVRFLHFMAAYVFIAVMIVRLGWAFTGNRYAKWTNFVPLKKQQFKELIQVARVEVLQVSNEPIERLGHNTVACFSYTAMFCLGLFQIASGLALLADASNAAWAHLFAWVVPLFGSEFRLRFYHEAAMWVFTLFVLVHVYLCCYEDYVGGRGAISSMIGGWKFTEKKKEPVKAS